MAVQKPAPAKSTGGLPPRPGAAQAAAAKPAATPAVAAAKPATAAKPAAKAPAPQKSSVFSIPIPEGADLGGGVPEGTYLLQLVEGPKEEASTRQESLGELQTSYEFEIIDDAFPEQKGRKGWMTFSREPAYWWRHTNMLEALGIPYTINEARTMLSIETDGIIGLQGKGVWKKSKKEANNPQARAYLNQILPATEVVESLEGTEIEESAQEISEQFE
ncbi:MAG: hypothetical protein WC291_10120 [Thermodesulfovibrionales bacterium]